MLRRQKLCVEEEAEEPHINLTPLIDVVFVLLITFMLLAPILDIDRVELAASGEGSRPSASHSPFSISIRSDDSIYFRGSSVSLKELEVLLIAEKRGRDKKCPQIAMDKRAHFGIYQDVKNILEACGFEQMDVLLQ